MNVLAKSSSSDKVSKEAQLRDLVTKCNNALVAVQSVNVAQAEIIDMQGILIAEQDTALDETRAELVRVEEDSSNTYIYVGIGIAIGAILTGGIMGLLGAAAL